MEESNKQIKIDIIIDTISNLLLIISITFIILGAMITGILNYIGVPEWLYILTCLFIGTSVGYLYNLHDKINDLTNGGKENENN